MADEELRETERAWRAAPDDQAALGRHIAALRRAGRVVPEALLDARVLPPGTFRSGIGVTVRVGLPDGEQLDLEVGAGGAVELPVRRWSWVLLGEDRTQDELRRLSAVCADQEVERVRLLLDGLDAPAIVASFVTDRLTHLELFGDASLAPDVQAALTGPSLVSVGLHEPGPAGSLAPLVEAAPGLERVAVDVTPESTEEELRPLRRLTRLRDLRLGTTSPQVALASPFRAAFLESLPVEPGLETFWADGVRLDDAALRVLSRHRRLERLVLPSGSRITDDGLRSVSALPLRDVEVMTEPGALTDASCHALAGCPLRRLVIHCTSITDAGLATLPTTLEVLRGVEGRWRGLDWVARLRSLRALGVDVIRGASLAPLAQLALRWLSLLPRRRATMPLPDLRPLAAISSLRKLHLNAFATMGDGLAPLSHHPGLTRVQLVGQTWTDDLLEPLATLPALAQLTFTDARGLTARAFEVLARCSALRRLDVSDAPALDARRDELRAIRPDIVVTGRDELMIDAGTGDLHRAAFGHVDDWP